MKHDALRQYEQEILAYRIRGGEKPPQPPELLKPRRKKKKGKIDGKELLARRMNLEIVNDNADNVHDGNQG